MSALPKPAPIPTRPDEEWRVAPESFLHVVEDGGLCTSRYPGGNYCHGAAVAATWGESLLLCDAHLHQGRMWIEKGRVVSWAMSPRVPVEIPEEACE